MKRYIIYLIAAVSLFFTRCELEPVADFDVSTYNAYAGEPVYFYNRSYDADYFEWDFGDGYGSTAINPVHIYSDYGTYYVTLTAYYRGSRSDRVSMIIEVYPETILEIMVLEYYDEYPVPDASVILYPSLYDWDNETNPLVEGFTDGNGIVTFTGLDAVPYYIDVWHSSHNNYLLREEDIGWIKTLPLIPGEVNTFVAYVDYIRTGSQYEGKKQAKYKIIDMKRALKNKTTINKSKD